MDETTIDLRDIGKALKKRYQLIINICLGFIIVSLMISFLTPPTYEAETTIRVKQPKGLASSLLDFADPMNTKQLMGTYSEILKSRTVVQEVINKTQSGQDVVSKYEQMVGAITTQPVKDTEVLKVKVKGKSPEEAQYVANTLVETFTERLTTLARAEQAVIRQFVGERLTESKQELEKAETALEGYKRTQRLAVLPEQSKALVDKLSSIDKLKAENTVNLAVAQAKLESVEGQLAKEKAGFIAESPFINQYKAKLADLEVELVSLLRNYTEKHPKVIAVRAAIEETRSKLNTEITRVVSADAASINPIHVSLLQLRMQAEAEASAGLAQKKAIERLATESEKEITQLPAKEQGLTRLMREAQVAQEIYIMLAKRYEEARINEVMQPTDIQLIDKAIAPERPISPRKALNMAIGGILGLFIGIGLAFYLEYANRKIQNSRDAKEYLGLPVLGIIPNIDNSVAANGSILIKLQNSSFYRRWKGK